MFFLNFIFEISFKLHCLRQLRSYTFCSVLQKHFIFSQFLLFARKTNKMYEKRTFSEQKPKRNKKQKNVNEEGRRRRREKRKQFVSRN